MVNITVRRYNARWFGIAWSNEALVATAVGPTQEKALKNITRCIPSGVPTRIVHDSSPFISGIIAMLSDLESGNEEHKRYTFSREYLSGPMYRIYTAAAAIPTGYVSTYGDIAKGAGSEARAVGRAMARNPLYPVVPCHRVVGANMSLVGYGGNKDPGALKAKLARIASEVRGAQSEMKVAVKDGFLTIYPAEWVLRAADEMKQRKAKLEHRKSERAAADRMQTHLF